MRLLSIIALGFMCGCGSQRVEIPPEILKWQAQSAQAPHIPDVRGDLGELRQDLRTSANLAQQSITGLGANFGKLSDTVQGFGGDLAHINATLRAETEVKTEVTASLKASLQAQAELKADLKVLADMRAELQALAGAQAGLKNEMEQLSQTARAGRDAVQSTTQFSKEMADTLQRSYLGTVVIVIVLACVIVWDKERSRRRAESRAAEHQTVLRQLGEEKKGKIGL